MFRNDLGPYDHGMILYNDKNRIIARVRAEKPKPIAYIEFANLKIDFSDIIVSVSKKPVPYSKLKELCWNHALAEVEKVRDKPQYAAVFTRIDVGNGYNRMLSSMNQVLSFIYDRWYEEKSKKEFEANQYGEFVNTRFHRRIDRQNYYS